jgi:S-adenosylmethionine-diacylglycerol 3-amino-3-carboxypropyl transferase
LEVDFVDPLQVEHHDRQVSVGDLLQYNQALATQLHGRDRVHTYGSFYIADLRDFSDGITSPTHEKETTEDERRWDTQDALSTQLLADSR